MKQVLSIAGFDSNGTAGLATDMHAFYADHVLGEAVLTGVVTENATAVTATQEMPVSFIQEEFKDLAEFDISAVKTGMLATTDVINCVADELTNNDFGPLVLDPVIVTKRHDRLISDEALQIMCKRLIPLTHVITPNYAEAEELTGMNFNDREDMMNGAQKLQKMGADNVVIKGSHIPDQNGQIHSYVLLKNGQDFWMNNDFVKTNKINGAGDSFAAIITAEIAKGASTADAIKAADQFIAASLQYPLSIGKKFGPINHWAGESSLTD